MDARASGGIAGGDRLLGGASVMSVVQFEALQELSGYKQVSKVIEWLREHRIRYVVGGDGKPRTTDDFLAEDLDGKPAEKKATPVLFGR
ncbi:MAG: DUF4224 domain-containing protein [Euryarchaeota archaeon]|nr:DUF4224 domain-containing protein [Euryarchaeota archaeon]